MDDKYLKTAKNQKRYILKIAEKIANGKKLDDLEKEFAVTSLKFAAEKIPLVKPNPIGKRALSNENVSFKQVGILAELSSYLKEPEKEKTHTLYDLLGNSPFLHRAYPIGKI